MEPKPKKWMSKRLKEKKDELGIKTPSPPVEEKTYEKVRKVIKPKENNDVKKNSYKNSEGKKNSYNKSDSDGKRNSYNRINKKKHVIKISNLPNDIHVKELAELVSPWGEIGNINIKDYKDVICSYIDFYNEEEAQYFISALHSTPFDNMIIRVELMNFDNKPN